jgi:peptidyl-prolyl cis-trans isomerase SurA
MTRLAVLPLLACALVVGGCAIPTWVPWLGQKPQTAATAPPVKPVEAPPPARPVERVRVMPQVDGNVADRVVAVVNNDAITLGELLERIAAFRLENRQRAGATPSDDELATQFLNSLIETRLQLQEADRERITVEEAEVNDELLDRVKKLGAPNLEAFEESLKQHGMSIDAVRKRVRDGIRMSRVIRRKVTLRVSVTDVEIDRYLDANRSKLETGLAYHARHILLTPENQTEASWAAAKGKADAVRAEAVAGADFAELAKRHSLDASARDGGDLGTLKRGELAQEVEAQILRLEPGEVSQPFRSSLGWHVFKLDTKEVLEGEQLVRARKQIHDILFREKYEARHDAWLKEIRQRAIIETRM